MISIEQKVGFFVLAALSVLLYGIFMLGDISFQKKYKLYVEFNNIEGLPDQAPVKVSGVEVGRVGKITLQDSKAVVEVWIQKDVIIHHEAQASIVSTGIIGSKFLQLTRGDLTLPPLKKESVIIGKDAFSYEKVFEKALDGIDEFKKVLSEVRSEGAFGSNLNEAVRHINRIAARLDEITLQHDEDIKVTLKNLREISEGMKKTLKSINDVAEKINNGDGVVGKLVNDKEMGEDLKSAVKEAKRVLDRINMFRTYWDYRLRYDSKNSLARSDLGLRVYPREDKYYFLGVNNAGDNADSPDDPEKKNTISAEIGKSFGPVTLHAGIIRSKGGVGAVYKPLKRVELTADAYNFSRKIPKKRPVYNAGARFKLTNWGYLGGQVEDIASGKSFNSYLNIVFEDKDIAYLLGLAGLAAK